MYYTLVYSDMSRPPRTNVVIAHCDNFRSRKGMPRDIRYGKIMFSNLSERDLEFFKMQQYLFTTKFIVDKSTSFAKLKERVAIHLL